jgi:hypothetical protein
MFSNIYKTKSAEKVVTSISGGREHYPARDSVKPVGTYQYSLRPGDNFYVLSQEIFGDDSFWWVLDDLNPPKDVFDYETGETVVLPKNIVAENRTKKRIF